MSQSTTPSRLRNQPAPSTDHIGADARADAGLVGAEFVHDAPSQFNDDLMSDRRNPSPQSFDVLAPDGYLHAMQDSPMETPAPSDSPRDAQSDSQSVAESGIQSEAVVESGLEWSIGVEAPHTTMSELVMGATSEIAARGGGRVTWWRAGATPHDDRVAAHLGFSRVRSQHQLRVALPVAFDPHHLTTAIITSFCAETDAEAWLVANNAAFRDHHEQSGWDRSLLDERTAQPWFNPELFLVARDEPDGPIVAFNWLKTHEADDHVGEPRLGEIYVIGVIPEAQGRGLGYSLAGLGLRALHVRGISTAMLFVAADNAKAIALYRRLGFAMHRTDAAYSTSVTAL